MIRAENSEETSGCSHRVGVRVTERDCSWDLHLGSPGLPSSGTTGWLGAQRALCLNPALLEQPPKSRMALPADAHFNRPLCTTQPGPAAWLTGDGSTGAFYVGVERLFFLFKLKPSHSISLHTLNLLCELSLVTFAHQPMSSPTEGF